MERALTEERPNPKALAIHSELSLLDDRSMELAEMVAQGEFTRLQYQAAMKKIQERKRELETTLAKERGWSGSLVVLGIRSQLSRSGRALILIGNVRF